jgi:dTDP-4-dehydrorhamnose reductase
MPPPLELWGGVECTVNRVGDRFRDQLVLSGHHVRLEDLDRFAALGLRTLRFPVLWERTATADSGSPDWRWSDARLDRARELGIRPIVTLVHHGSGPAGTHLLDPAFPARLARYARLVAERYPWVDAYTPVNEPLTTARFSALYGLWYPHGRSDLEFVRAVLNQCRASVLAMRAIREVTPAARFLQTEDLGRTEATRMLAYQAAFDNERRWLTFDLLTGRLGPDDRLWRHMRGLGIEEAALEWFRANPCAPDLLGINHYLTSNRYLDTDLERYPPDTWGGNGRHRYADVEAVRVVDRPPAASDLLAEAWDRFRLPLAITEVHLGCTREEQLRWLRAIWDEAHRARERGVDVRAVTAWALLGTFDWNSLLTRAAGHYEPGAFDVRGPAPRLTALGRMVAGLAAGESAPALARAPGWWERSVRFGHGHGKRAPAVRLSAPVPEAGRPMLVTGAGGTLASAVERSARLRGLEVVALDRRGLDIADDAAVADALERYEPWAVVNAAGYVRVRDAEREPGRCHRDNSEGAAHLAAACRPRAIALVTFSSDLVFSGDGRRRPYLESDVPAPASVYGASKAAAERRVAELMPEALVIRTSAFFGPWDRYNLLTQGLEALRAGREWTVPRAVVSPTFLPDLVNAALDLLIDGERGIWHLANQGGVSWIELLRAGAELAGVNSSRLREEEGPDRSYTVLGSERGALLPRLDDAVERYIREVAAQPALARPTDPSALPAAGA